MIRKTILALTATAAVGAAALAPTAASAWPFGHHGYFGHFGHFGLYRGFGPIVIGPSCIRWVETRWGLRRVNVCDY